MSTKKMSEAQTFKELCEIYQSGEPEPIELFDSFDKGMEELRRKLWEASYMADEPYKRHFSEIGELLTRLNETHKEEMSI